MLITRLSFLMDTPWNVDNSTSAGKTLEGLSECCTFLLNPKATKGTLSIREVLLFLSFLRDWSSVSTRPIPRCLYNNQHFILLG
jgi:hypothetical protein